MYQSYRIISVFLRITMLKIVNFYSIFIIEHMNGCVEVNSMFRLV